MHKQQIKQASVYSFNKYLLSIRACARAPCWALGTWRRVISFLSPGSYRPGGQVAHQDTSTCRGTARTQPGGQQRWLLIPKKVTVQQRLTGSEQVQAGQGKGWVQRYGERMPSGKTQKDRRLRGLNRKELVLDPVGSGSRRRTRSRRETWPDPCFKNLLAAVQPMEMKTGLGSKFFWTPLPEQRPGCRRLSPPVLPLRSTLKKSG